MFPPPTTWPIYAEYGGNIDVALSLAQAAKEQVPDNANISDTLGWIYYKKNLFGTAITYLKEAAEKNPKQPTIRYHLGMAYYKDGKKELAGQELRETLQLDPNFEKAAEIKKVLAELGS